MSILIKGMEMPECCGYCPFEYKNYCMAKPSLAVESADRHPRCPLVPVPPHGDLMDRDDFLATCPELVGGYKHITDGLVVIPAEEGET